MTPIRDARLRPLWIGGALAVLAYSISADTAARAADPEYIGTWGRDAAHCTVGQDLAGAPLIVTPMGYDQHEAHCIFTSVWRGRGVWKVSALCAVDGGRQADAFTMRIDGNMLTIARGPSEQQLQRCE